MKNVMLICAATLALSGLSACTDFTSPQGVIGTAYKALKLNDPKLFTKTLTGEALERFGNLDGMAKLQNELAGLDVVAGKTTETSEVLIPNTQRASLRTYTVEIMGKKTGDATAQFARVMTATVPCVIDYEWQSPHEYYGDYPFPHGRYDWMKNEKSGEKFYTEYWDCKISNLN